MELFRSEFIVFCDFFNFSENKDSFQVPMRSFVI